MLVKVNGWWLFHIFHVSFGMEGLPALEDGKSPVLKVRILGIPIIDTSRKGKDKGKKRTTKEDKPSGQQENTVREPQLTVQELSGKDGEEPDRNKPAVKEPDKKEPAAKEPAVEETVGKEEEKRGLAVEEPAKKEQEAAEREKIQNIAKSIGNIRGKIELVRGFLSNEENKRGIKKIFASLKGILKHLLPNKIKGQVHFGLGDPCATGQALGVLAIFYPYYGKSLSIEPDFSEQILEGEIYLKGYMQVFTLCVIGIKLLIDPNFTRLRKNFMKLKEEL